MEYITLLEVAESGEVIDFHFLYKILVHGNVFNHVYSDYVAPVVKLFESTEYFRKYYATVGNSIAEFVTTLSERLEECYSSVGWPFKAASSFGTLMKKILLIVPDDQVRLLFFKQLWKLAFGMDQWSVQREIVEVLTDNYISAAVASPLAEFIVQTETEVDLERFQGIVMPRIIKMAIINTNKVVQLKMEGARAARGLDGNPDF